MSAEVTCPALGGWSMSTHRNFVPAGKSWPALVKGVIFLRNSVFARVTRSTLGRGVRYCNLCDSALARVTRSSY